MTAKAMLIVQILCCMGLASLLFYEFCARGAVNPWARYQEATIVLTYLAMMIFMAGIILSALSY